MNIRPPALVLATAVIMGLACALSPCMAAERDRIPAPVESVNDFADVIPPDYEMRINSLARALWAQTGTALVVATFPDLGETSPEEFASRLYETWGIGKKGEDKGVLILVALKERRVRVETGYGVESVLPDAKVGDVLDGYIVPALQRGQFGEGLLNGSLAFAQIVAQDAGVELRLDDVGVMPPQRLPERRGGYLLPLLFVLFVIFGVLGRGMGVFPLAVLPWMMTGGGYGGRGSGRSIGGFGGGFGGFGGGLSGGGGATRGF